MNSPNNGRRAVWLSFPLALLLVIASAAGVFLPSVYAVETRLSAAQFVGADALNLLVVVPVLIASAVLALCSWTGARVLWAGTVLYVLYAFVYYTLSLHFNSLFLVYCAVFGLSFYTLIGALPRFPIPDIASRSSGRRATAVATAILFLFIVLGAGFHWVDEISTALRTGRTPHSITDTGMLTETPAVLDIAFLLPALTVIAILLLRRRPLGLAIAPVFLVLTVYVALLLTAMDVMMVRRGLQPGDAGPVAYLAAAGIASVLLVLSLPSGTTEQRSDGCER